MSRPARALVVNAAVAAVAIVTLVPLLWMVSASFMPPGAANTMPPPLVPRTPTLEHYVALFSPVVTTLVAVAIVWRYLYHPHYGLIDFALRGLGLPAVDWLGDPHWAMPAIILFAVWKSFGYNMVILLAGLQGIPQELYEAARIDGASAPRQFRYITLPMLAPMLAMVGILTIAGYFQLFAEPYVMTQGGPLQSTVSVLYFMYEEGFKWWNLGTASAVAFILFLIIFGATALPLRGTRLGTGA